MDDQTEDGDDWTDLQIDLIVADYFSMLAMDLRQERFNKAERNRALQALTGRNRGSIEFKHANISAVMEKLGLPWLRGYAPRRKYQGALVDGVARHLAEKPRLVSVSEPKLNRRVEESPILFLEPAPQMPANAEPIPEKLERLVRKFDPAGRDARNRELGKRGENVVYLSEVARLRADGRNELAQRVRWVSEEDGDGAGFDILSFDADGRERLIEVKTTDGGNLTPFYISENERSLSDERPEEFRIVRLFDFARAVRAFEVAPPLADHLHLTASVWKATPS
jgi:hypothetical protein